MSENIFQSVLRPKNWRKKSGEKKKNSSFEAELKKISDGQNIPRNDENTVNKQPNVE